MYKISKKKKNLKIKVLWNSFKLKQFQSSVNRSKIIVKIGTDFVCMLVLSVSTTCGNFKSFGALLNVMSFSFSGYNFQNEKNFKKSFD